MLKGKLMLGLKERLRFKSMSSTKFQKLCERLKLTYMSSKKLRKSFKIGVRFKLRATL